MSTQDTTNGKSETNSEPVPGALRFWFLVHFAADMLFAIPLLVAPFWLLGLLGWETIDPIASRMTAAALFGIGIESFLARNKPREAYKPMLNLKIIWSFGTIIGILVTQVATPDKAPVMSWAVLGIFIAFNVLWIYWRVRLGRK